MVDPAKVEYKSEPGLPRPESFLSTAEAEGKRDEFREAMRDNPQKDMAGGAEEDRKTGSQDNKNETALPSPFSGDALLHSLGKSYAPLETKTVATVGSKDISILATELAEHVLVSTGKQAAGSEVRLTLKESLLPDTEIFLRQEGERLVVQLVSGNSASLETLHLARHDLHDKLMALGQEVSVEVLDKRAGENGDFGRSNARSRGLDYFMKDED